MCAVHAVHTVCHILVVCCVGECTVQYMVRMYSHISCTACVLCRRMQMVCCGWAMLASLEDKGWLKCCMGSLTHREGCRGQW